MNSCHRLDSRKFTSSGVMLVWSHHAMSPSIITQIAAGTRFRVSARGSIKDQTGSAVNVQYAVL